MRKNIRKKRKKLCPRYWHKSIHYNLNLNKKVKSINYTHVDNFIDSVMLNPFAPDWFNETLSQLCKNYNINYLGKSNLYDTPNKE